MTELESQKASEKSGLSAFVDLVQQLMHLLKLRGQSYLSSHKKGAGPSV